MTRTFAHWAKTLSWTASKKLYMTIDTQIWKQRAWTDSPDQTYTVTLSKRQADHIRHIEWFATTFPNSKTLPR